MHNPNWLQSLKGKRINSLAKFLKNISNSNFHTKFISEKYGSLYHVYVSDLLLNFLLVADKRNYLIGVSIGSSGDGNPVIILDSPVVTPEGEAYITSKSFFSRHPIFEKVFFVLLTGFVSGLVSYFASIKS